MLITNDILRDHTLLLRDPLLGREWYNRHVVNFKFDKSEVGKAGGKSTPSFYQKGIQGNVCPVLLGNETGGIGTAWHFPVNGWGLYERFVVRIPTHTE